MSELEALLTASLADPTARTALYQHHRRIGSGDIAAVAALYVPEWAHLVAWKNASDVWLRLCHGVDLPSSDRMRRGLNEEPRLRELYRETFGECSEAPGTVQHPSLEWACGSPDGYDAAGIVELKTHSVYSKEQWGAPGTGFMPDKYLLQGAWLCEVTGRRQVTYLVSFGRDIPAKDGGGWLEESTAVYRLHDDAELRARLVEFAQRFYDAHVNPRVPPELAPVANKREFKRLTKNGRNQVGGTDEGAGEGAVSHGVGEEGVDESGL